MNIAMNRYKCESGLTLIEIMITLGVVGVLLLAIAQFAFNYTTQQNREETAEESLEAMLLPLRVLKKDIEYADFITNGSPSTLSLHALRSQTGLAPENVDIAYSIVDTPCLDGPPSAGTCKTLSRSLSINLAPPTITSFQGLADLAWCLPGSSFAALGACPANLLALAPPEPGYPAVGGKRFFVRVSRQTARMTIREDMALVVDLENMGYGTAGAGYFRPLLVRPQ